MVPDGQLNTSYNALDRHVDAGQSDQPALIYDSPVTSTKRSYSYLELRDQVALFTASCGRWASVMATALWCTCQWSPKPSSPCFRLCSPGAIHSVVFGGFAPAELAARIDDARPVAVVTASCGIGGSKVLPYLPLLERRCG